MKYKIGTPDWDYDDLSIYIVVFNSLYVINRQRPFQHGVILTLHGYERVRQTLLM